MGDQTPKANAGQDATDFDALRATEYLVLKALPFDENVPAGSWMEVQSVMATSASGAIRAALAKNSIEQQTGTFVAVPVRSFKPVTVNPQTTIRLELTEAKA